MNSVCIFCGASKGNNPAFEKASKEFATKLAEKNLTVVYGGASVGLMGTVADAALAAGGKVVGVIPEFLQKKELAHRELTELHIVDSMAARKQKLYDLSESFVALPGGLGTLDELFEMLTWAQLEFNDYPMGLLNIDGFYDPLLEFIEKATQNGFLRIDHTNSLKVGVTPDDLLNKMSIS